MPVAQIAGSTFETLAKKFAPNALDVFQPASRKALDFAMESGAKNADQIPIYLQQGNIGAIHDIANETMATTQAVNRREQMGTIVKANKKTIDDVDFPQQQQIAEQAQQEVSAYRLTQEGQEKLAGAYDYLQKHGTLKGYILDDEGLYVARNKVGPAKVNYKDQKGISIVSQEMRNWEALKRLKSTNISEKEVYALAEEYDQSKETAKAFLEAQKKGKKALEDRVAKINSEVKKRFANNPEFAEKYKKLKASLGHIKAAENFEHSADILTNLELENYFTNVTRQNKAELPRDLTIALGASRDLNEEFLKFIDADLGDWSKGMTKRQKTLITNRRQELIDQGIEPGEALDVALQEAPWAKTTARGKKVKEKTVWEMNPAEKDVQIQKKIKEMKDTNYQTSGMGGRTYISDRD